SELVKYKRAGPYSRLHAQFFSLLLDAQANRGEMTGLAIIAAKSLIKVLLFTAIAVSTLGTGIASSLASKTPAIVRLTLSFRRSRIRWSSLNALRGRS